MSFDIQLYEKIIIPFFKEINLRNQLNGSQNFESYVYMKYKDTTIPEILIIAKQNLFSNSINSYNFENPLPSRDELSKRFKQLTFVEVLFDIKLVNNKEDIIFNDEIKDLLIYLIGIQTYMSSYRLEQINEINIYLDFCIKLMTLYRESSSKLTRKDLKWFNFLKRCLYLTLHETRFEQKKEFYTFCINLIKEDIEYSKNVSLKEYIFTLTNYIYISLDHLNVSINSDIDYINKNEHKSFLDELKKQSFILSNDKTLKSYKLYKIFSVIFLNNVYLLKLEMKKNKQVLDSFKIILLIQLAELIRIFYGKHGDYSLFMNLSNSKYTVGYNIALKAFSEQLMILLNEKEINIIDPLFIVFNFLSNFKEYNKLNINIYNRINFVSRTYYYRKIYVLSTILYIKSFKDPEMFKKEINKVKRNIEINPIKSLITLYNNEISSMTELPPNLINHYKADSNIIQIHEKIYHVNKIIFAEISKYKNESLSDKDYNIKLGFMFNLQNEIKNILNVVIDPTIVIDLGQFYSFFIDNFIKNRGMEYREDFINKATVVKMSVIDINPLNFALGLLFSKIGKLKLIIDHNNPAKLGIKKKMLTNLEKEEIGSYINFSSNYLPKDEGRFNWGSIDYSIKHLRLPAIKNNIIAPPESRILKIVCAILNKITRQDVLVSNVFPSLLEEAYNPAKRIWDLDPLLIFYFHSYFARSGKKFFINENTGEKIEVGFHNPKGSLIFEKINDFIQDLLEVTELGADSLAVQLEELAEGNVIDLIDKKGQKLNIGLTEIKSFVNTGKTLAFSTNFIKDYDLLYLVNIMTEYFTVIGKNSLAGTFKFILTELISNSNKANLKRAHFYSRNIDISKYDIGMINFLDMLKNKKQEYIDVIKELNLEIRIVYSIFNNNFTISVINNYKINNREIKLINDAVQNSKLCKNLKDVYKIKTYTKEGKGYGLIIILLFLRKFGLNKQFFKLNIKENETLFSIDIPFEFFTEEDENILSDEIVKEIETIPMIPESIQELKTMVKNPEVELEEISKSILKDPALSADVIRIANSAFYMLTKPVSTVIDGIKIIGTDGLSNILTIYTSYKLLESKISRQKIIEIINHSDLTAYYAKKLVKLLELKINLDDIYLASLLHDIGKIVVEGLHPDIYNNIQNSFDGRYVPIELLEDLAGGIDHSLIGYKIAKKWKFPSLVNEVIRFHHNPREANAFPEEVFLVYLANLLTYYNSGKILYENIDLNVLEFFELNSSDKLKEIAEKLIDFYIPLQF